jgi:hypothetical protein
MVELKILKYFSITLVLIVIINNTLEQQYLSDSRIDWEGLIGGRLPKALRTPNRTWWTTKAWSGLSPLGLPQLSVGLGAISGNL